MFWRTFIRQCSVVELVEYELKSMIKSNGLYAVNGVYYVSSKGREVVGSNDPVLLPKTEERGSSAGSSAGASAN